MNNLNTIKFHFPELKPSFDKIINLVKSNIIIKYRENENNIRIKPYEKELLKEEIEDYFRNLNLFDNYIIRIINKDEYLLKYINNNQQKDDLFYNLLINDYFNIFFYNMTKKKKMKYFKYENEKLLIVENLENNIKFLNFMINLRNISIENNVVKDEKDKNNKIDKLAKSINWVESYFDEIIILEKIFSKLNKSIPGLYEYIEEIIKNNKIKYKSLNNCFSIINETFFLSINSLLRIIYSKIEIYESSDSNLLYLISNIKEIIEDILQLENNLNLYSGEITNIQEIYQLLELMSEYKLINLNSINNIFKYFEIVNENNNNTSKLCNNLKNLYKFLITKIENKNIYFYKVLSYIFICEYNKIQINEFRELIIEIILENNFCIQYSSSIFKNIIDNIIDINPKEMINNIEKIKDEKSLIFKKINNMKNAFLDEIIMNIFEGKIMIYFESIQDLNNNIIEELYPKYFKYNQNLEIKTEKGIIFDTSLKIFEKIIKYLDEKSTIDNIDKNEENKNIFK